MFNTMEVAQKIRRARIAKNMTQMALADEMGVSFQAVSNWERGNSLPDIGKLPDLCRILGLEMNDLLGTGTRESRTVEKLVNREKVDIEELAEVAPIVPPDQIESTFRREEESGGRIDFKKILPLAPFLDEEYLGELALRASVTDLEGLRGAAPFLSEKTLSEITENFLKKGGEKKDLKAILPLAPFLDDNDLDRIVLEYGADDDLRDVHALAPFLSEQALDKIVERALGDGVEKNMEDIVGLAPFLDEKTLRKTADAALWSGDYSFLSQISRFL